MQNPPSTLQRLREGLMFRARIVSTLLRLKAKSRLSGPDVVVDYGWAKLPFTNDGDLQEAIYHAHANSWHRKEITALTPYIPKGACVLDVGANMGFMSLIFRELVGANGSVFSFEPSGKTFKKLQRVLALNGCDNVTPFQKGCGDKAAQMTLYQTALASGNASVLGTTEEHKRSTGETIDIVRLDEFILPLARKVDFVKIDTEGFEPAVLRGATGLMTREKPMFRIELNCEFRESCMESVSFLKSHGYKFLEEPDLKSGYFFDDFIAVPA